MAKDRDRTDRTQTEHMYTSSWKGNTEWLKTETEQIEHRQNTCTPAATRESTDWLNDSRDLETLVMKNSLKECGLTTLETRRLRGDQIEVA